MAKKKDKNWMKGIKEGTFTSYCKNKGYKGVTNECIAEGKNSPDAKTQKRANLAETFRSMAKNKKKKK